MYDDKFSIYEIRAFSVSNLIDGAAVIEAPDPRDFPDSKWSVNNLIENQENRSSVHDKNAITDWDGVGFDAGVVTRSS